MRALTAGSRVGPYEVVGPLGAGGMGEVYRARDPRIGREVAIKVLPEAAAADPERLRRFEQEARAAGALSHPSVLTVFDVGFHEGAPYLVFELLEGETLRERLGAGGLTQRKAVGYGVEIAEGLAAAHAKGIVHRDLKPENLFVSRDGRVKILDFGLAKLRRAPAEAAASEHETASNATSPGVFVGTAAYTSPEQAQGLASGPASDIFSLGVVLYEMLARRRPFRGDSTPGVLASVLRDDPPELSSLDAAIPAALDRIVRRCLEKRPEERFHSAHDLALALEAVSSGQGERTTPPSMATPGRLVRRRLLPGLAAGVLAAGLAFWATRRPPTARPIYRFAIELARPGTGPVELVGEYHSPFALSPDGRFLAFVGRSGERTQLYLRPMDALDARPIPGTDGASVPFFSPDSEWLGFAADGKLRKVPVRGGEVIAICDAAWVPGASWGPDGTILFAPATVGGLYSVAATGGKPQALTEPGRPLEDSHRWPRLLPGGKAALFSIMTGSARAEEQSIAVVSLQTRKWRVLIQEGTEARYVATGHILYGRAGSILAAPFDLDRLEVTGPSLPVLDDVWMISKGTGAVGFDVSAAGSLVYAPGYPHPPDRELLRVDRSGKAALLTPSRRPYSAMSLSPDGQRLAVTIEGAADDVWVYDLGRQTWTRLTFEADNGAPVWSGDGTRVIFQSNRKGPYNLFSVPADGSASAAPLMQSTSWLTPTSVSADGTLLAFNEDNGSTEDIGLLPLQGGRKPWPFLATPFQERAARFSPNGRWVAYTSDESGRSEVYVRSCPGPGPKWPISTAGGAGPRWARTGRELFYWSGDKLMAVPVRTEPDFSPGPARVLFEMAQAYSYEVTADARQFVVVRGPEAEAEPLRLVAVPDWFAEMKARLARASR